MIIGVPKEIKNNENRVALTPGAASQLIAAGHRVIIEANAGAGSGFDNEDYVSVGAEIAEQAKAVWNAAEMVMKVKEPLPEEYPYFRICFSHSVGDIDRIGHERLNLMAELIVKLAQPVCIQVSHGRVRPKTDCNLGGVCAGNAAADNDHFSPRHTGNPG